jgi:two-component system, NarL family, sensor histidine kinase DegS
MKRGIAWSDWSIFTKILVTFLGLAVVAMVIIGSMALVNIRNLGNHALETSESLGETAIRESTAALNQLGEAAITQKAQDVARQVEMYLAAKPPMTAAEMRDDAALREITVQPVGETGYTTLFDLDSLVILIHRFPEQERDILTLMETLPAFWGIVESATGGKASAGYYDWREVDGRIRQKYASIVPVVTPDGRDLNLWATTYIDEFSRPAADTREGIGTAILSSRDYIHDVTTDIRTIFITVFVLVIGVVAGLALLLSRAITRPVIALQQGAREIGAGNLDYNLDLKSRDELGELAGAFNQMALSLKHYTQELEATARENIAQEREIQRNLRQYAQKISQAQEKERKRIARELHDDTVQALVVVSRHLEELAVGETVLSPAQIREEVRQIMEGVRRFSQELRPSALDDLGLIPAVQWLAAELDKSSGIRATASITGEPHQLNPEADLMLFRIVQEALNNVRHHSGATGVTVEMDFTGAGIKVEIRDNGQGFQVPARLTDLTGQNKLGLVGMQERAQLMGGNLTVRSQPGQGTTLTFLIPSQPKENHPFPVSL